MSKVKSFFKVKDSYNIAKLSLFLSIVIGLLAYNQFIINGYTNPDGIVEGLTSYINATWHIAGCGRWFLPIIQSLFANVNVPFLIVLFYCFFIWLSAFTIAKLWEEENCFYIVAISLVMCVTRTAFDQITTNSIAIADAVACFMSTYFVYLVFKKQDIFSCIVATACICCSLGIFQPYIGLSAVLTVMTIIIELIKGETDILFKKIVTALVCAIVGTLLYFIGLKLIMSIFHLSSSGRMAVVSFKSVFETIWIHIKHAYYLYFYYFNDHILNKNILYFFFTIVCVIVTIFNVYKKHDSISLIIVLLMMLIPLSSNLAVLVTPEITFATNMSYQNILIIPFAITISKLIIEKTYISKILIIISIVLCWLNTLSINATLICYRLSNESIKYQMSEIIGDVIHNDDYVLNESPVIFVGYPNDSALRKEIKTYKYAYDFDEINNIVFWDNTEVGYTYNRRNYILDYFGLDMKEITFDDYMRVINSKEFEEMPLWPNNDGIKKINDILVVKLTNEPFRN